jgi:RHS repeat-associated protein
LGNFIESFVYNAIDSITSKSDQGSYQYSGNTGTNYANPHAPTTINSVALTYDSNGNLLSHAGRNNSWNYRNELVSTTGTASTTAVYDHVSERIQYTDTSSATIYPNREYDFETVSDTKTKYIYAADDLVATIETKPVLESMNGYSSVEFEIEGQQSSSMCCQNEIPVSHTIHYVHSDHLGGSNVVTDSSGVLEETLDYYPFGKVRIDESTGSFSEAHKFIGEFYDEESQLSYLNARYHEGSHGQFLSQDPAFLAVGSPDLKQKTNMELAQYLSDPQVLNSYSYARNNPLKYVDQGGEFIQFAPAIIAVAAFVASSGHMIPGLIDNYRTTLSVAPGVGDAIAAKEAYTGRSFLNGNELGTGERLLSGLSAIPILGTLGDVGKTALRDEKLIKQIGDYAAQHSFQKHVIDQKEFGSMMKNESQLSEYAQGVMRNPSDVRQLSNGRTAFWDNRLGGVVIHNAQDPKQSTVFRPTTEFGRYNGKKFFNRLR